MLKSFFSKLPARSRTVQVGWVFEQERASVIWDAPKRVQREMLDVPHAKSVRYCPAVLDHEARYFEVVCPVDATIRLGKDEKTKEPVLINGAGDKSAIRSNHLSKMVVLSPRKEWRNPERPVLQVVTPYIFVADEPVYMTQMPPFMSFQKDDPWPGLQIGGRFPINIWPRLLTWAFEWHDTGKDLVLRRGQPWFYLKFETEDPSRSVRMVEAEMTEPLRRHIDSITAVTNYVNRTFSLFDRAKERRPKTLLVPKKR